MCCVFLYTTQTLLAQGCSDAGVCSIGTMHAANSGDSAPTASVGLTLSAGKGDGGAGVYSSQLELGYSVTPEFKVNAKLPFTVVSGNLGTVSGLSDIIASVSYDIKVSETIALSANGGLRIATGDASTSINSSPLPMQYQTSLGTTDILLGVAATIDSVWFTAVGFQLPIISSNKNGFDTATTLFAPADAKDFPPSRNLTRSADISIRFERIFLANDFTYSIGVLPIFHVANDTYLNSLGATTTLTGSAGVTLNITGSCSYQVDNNVQFKAILAAPAIVREIRPDGLTRSVLLSINATYAW